MSTSPNTLDAILGPSPEQLYNELETIFPPVNPSPGDDLSQLMYRAGQRHVVEWFKQRMKF